MTTTDPDTCQQCSTDQWEHGEGCIDGSWYGFCGHDNCYGMCEYVGDCGCTVCHGN